LERFPDQAKQREMSAAYMDEALSEVAGVRIFKRDTPHALSINMPLPLIPKSSRLNMMQSAMPWK
jgi:hypothetical protein